MNNQECASDLYTSIEEAKEEVWRRWNDNALRKEVDNFVGDVPAIFRNEPVAYLARYIATPNIEFVHFLQKAKEVNLKPIHGEYLDDCFSRSNIDKCALSKMYFISNNGNGNCKEIKVTDGRRNNGKVFTDIKTLWGEDFIDFHHGIFVEFASKVEVFDISPLYRAKGDRAKDFYPFLLALFLNHGILFDDFITYGHEAKFTCEIVRPAYEMIIERFGIKPLIVQLTFQNGINERHYPSQVKEKVLRRFEANEQRNTLFDGLPK